VSALLLMQARSGLAIEEIFDGAMDHAVE